MTELWTRKNILRAERAARTTTDPSTEPFMTLEDAAARVGIAPCTLQRWVELKIVPKPRKFSNRRAKKKFRREYVEALRDCMVIRNSATGYSTKKSFRNLVWTRLFGYR